MTKNVGTRSTFCNVCKISYNVLLSDKGQHKTCYLAQTDNFQRDNGCSAWAKIQQLLSVSQHGTQEPN